MRSLRKRVRALRSSKLFAEVLALRGSVKNVEDSKTHRAEDLKGNIKRFFEEVFGFTPFKYQEKLAEIFEKNQFIWVRWCRQSGKSFSVAALLLKYGYEHENKYIAIVGPSWRQTKLNIR